MKNSKERQADYARHLQEQREGVRAKQQKAQDAKIFTPYQDNVPPPPSYGPRSPHPDTIAGMEAGGRAQAARAEQGAEIRHQQDLKAMFRRISRGRSR
jgi:hypothetical protein